MSSSFLKQPKLFILDLVRKPLPVFRPLCPIKAASRFSFFYQRIFLQLTIKEISFRRSQRYIKIREFSNTMTSSRLRTHRMYICIKRSIKPLSVFSLWTEINTAFPSRLTIVYKSSCSLFKYNDLGFDALAKYQFFSMKTIRKRAKLSVHPPKCLPPGIQNGCRKKSKMTDTLFPKWLPKIHARLSKWLPSQFPKWLP
jgi:hypothetical protein